MKRSEQSGMESSVGPVNLVVEFFGISGVGKSTLAAKVLQRLSQIEVCSPATKSLHGSNDPFSSKVLRYIHFFCNRPRFAIAAIFHILASRQRSRHDLFFVLKHWFDKWSLLWSQVRAKGLWVNDEGIFVALWSVAFSAKREWILEDFYLKCCNCEIPGIVVVVDANVDTILRRLSTRTRITRLERQVKAESLSAVTRGMAVYKMVRNSVLREIESRNGLEIVFIDNSKDEDLDRNVDIIVERITSAVRLGESNNRYAKIDDAK